MSGQGTIFSVFPSFEIIIETCKAHSHCVRSEDELYLTVYCDKAKWHVENVFGLNMVLQLHQGLYTYYKKMVSLLIKWEQKTIWKCCLSLVYLPHYWNHALYAS